MSPNRIVLRGNREPRNFHRAPTRRTGARKRRERGMRAGWERGRRGVLVGRR